MIPAVASSAAAPAPALEVAWQSPRHLRSPAAGRRGGERARDGGGRRSRLGGAGAGGRGRRRRVRRPGRGSPGAAAAALRAHARRCEEARDAAQEVFLKAYRKAADFRPRGQVYTWLYRIATNHCLNKLRRRRLVRFVQLGGPGGARCRRRSTRRTAPPTRPPPWRRAAAGGDPQGDRAAAGGAAGGARAGALRRACRIARSPRCWGSPRARWRAGLFRAMRRLEAAQEWRRFSGFQIWERFS